MADGHTVTALIRRTGTDLEKLNVKTIQGTLKDVQVIADAAAKADAVLHLGFEHDFTDYQRCCEQDLAVVKAITKALSGSGKLFVNTASSSSPGDSGDNLETEDRPARGPRAESEAVTLQVGQLLLPAPKPAIVSSVLNMVNMSGDHVWCDCKCRPMKKASGAWSCAYLPLCMRKGFLSSIMSCTKLLKRRAQQAMLGQVHQTVLLFLHCKLSAASMCSPASHTGGSHMFPDLPLHVSASADKASKMCHC